jgi:hypothetical protein
MHQLLASHGSRSPKAAVALTTGQFEDIPIVVAGGRCLKANHFIRNRHFGPKLLSPFVSARRQGHTRDARRKAEVVLDPRRPAPTTATS